MNAINKKGNDGGIEDMMHLRKNSTKPKANTEL